MNPEEHGVHVWRAGDFVPAGVYLRVDDDSFRMVVMEQDGRLQASCDGHVAYYCRASALHPPYTAPESKEPSGASQ